MNDTPFTSTTSSSSSPASLSSPASSPSPLSLTSIAPDHLLLVDRFLESLRMRNGSPRTIVLWRQVLRRFVTWCAEREVTDVGQLTPELLASYRRQLFYYRTCKGTPLKFSTQASYLLPVRRWCAWLHEQRLTAEDVARQLQLPKEERRLPVDTLSIEQAESVLQLPDINTPLGLRDRALLETLYSTAIRGGELVRLDVYDLEAERGVIKVLCSKNRKDRVVPIGQRAQGWVEQYLRQSRPQLLGDRHELALFLSRRGRRLGRTYLSNRVRRYLQQIGIPYRGASHLFRHAAVTHMLEAGADLRSLQLMLGHERLCTTQIYTHVSIQRLQEVHRRTHPARIDRGDTQ